MFRTPHWQARYRHLERTERLRLPADRELDMLYFAEKPVTWPGERVSSSRPRITSAEPVPSLTILALQNTLIRVLAGSVLVTSSKGLVLTEDTCLLARGLIQLRAVAPGSNSSCSVKEEDGEDTSSSGQEQKPVAGAPPALWAIRNVDKQVIVEPQQGNNTQHSRKKIIIKKVFNCTETLSESSSFKTKLLS